jgi:hypothetical protein
LDAIERTFATAEMFASRAKLHYLLDNKVNAQKDLNKMLGAPGANLESWLEATALLDQLEPTLYDNIPTSTAFKSLSLEDRLNVAFQYEGSAPQLSARFQIMKQLDEDLRQRRIVPPTTQFALALGHGLKMTSIASGNFEMAIKLFTSPKKRIENMDISEAFNLGMAIWGNTGSANPQFFGRVVLCDEIENNHINRSPNYMQCLAIAHALVGNRERAAFFIHVARSSMASKPHPEFSAWTYTRVDSREFVRHLDEIENLANGLSSQPRFIVH